MNDFLSNFTKDNYDGKKHEPKDDKVDNADNVADEVVPEQPSEAVPVESTFDRVKKAVTPPTSEATETPEIEPVSKEVDSIQEEPEPIPTRRQSREQAPVSRFGTEETEFDPTYKKKQQKKYLIIGLLSVLAVAVIGFTYYQLTHVKVPNFKNEEVANVRTWGNDEGVKINVKQEYDFETATNSVISQNVAADKKIRKGKTLEIISSLGPDPEEKITLPDFAKMDKTAATDWITENKAENVTLIENYDDKLKKGVFIKQEFANKDLKAEDYVRKDRLMVYYSKGKEVFEKNIEVLEFKGKPVAEVEEWAKKNEAKLKIVKDFSQTIAEGIVISQEIAKGQKIAKDQEFIVHVSKGKAIEVPDYSQYTMEEATGLEANIPVVVKSLYSESVPYGQFISQSVEAGKQYNETDTIPTVKVVYSAGRPYIRDLRGSTSEGELAKLFFDEYESKGANIYYEVYYCDSAAPKGQVVEMSTYGQFISIGSTVWIGISLGNLTESIPESPTDDQLPPDSQEEQTMEEGAATVENQ